jgi:hypothetical protein
MKELKICYQQTYLPEPTFCFKEAGYHPCDASNCLVESAIEKIPFVYQSLIEQLCHSVCRISSVSQDNQEFLQRMANQGKKHLLSILE